MLNCTMNKLLTKNEGVYQMGLVSEYGVMMGKFAFKKFNGYTSKAMETQLESLMKILDRNKDCELGKKYGFADIHSFEEYQDKVPLSTFEDYAPLIDRMVEKDEQNIITSDKVIRYCSSSGSVGKPKLQPKTFQDLWNLHCCGLVPTNACAARYFRERGEKFYPTYGPLLLSLNGHKLKNGMMCNGAGQLPYNNIKSLLKFITCTPMDILYPEDEENTDIPYFQLRFALPSKKVSFLGGMVITLVTTMFEYLENNWEMICNDIEKGTIDPSVRCPESLRKKYGHMKPNPKRADELRCEFRKGFDMEVPIAKRIWPRLSWANGMVASSLSVYLDKLRRYVGDLPLHNMGYAASEGFMGMCVNLNEDDYVLLPRSIIYEFLPVDAPEDTRPLTLDQIEVGKDYEIIVTNFSGLYRYRILDIIRVTGTYNQSKRIKFLYRSNMGLNVANEKTTTQMLDFVAEKMSEQFGLSLEGYSFYGDTDKEIPNYMLLCETDKPEIVTEKKEEIEKFVDESFREANEKYEKYRRWGMLSEPEVLPLEKGAYDSYRASLVAQGRALNQIKPVVVLNTPEKKEFFFNKIITNN